MLQLSEKHLNKVEKTEDPAQKLKKFKKFYSRDSARYAKELRKYWRYKSDSLSNATKVEGYAKQVSQIGNEKVCSTSDLLPNELSDNVQRVHELDSGTLNQRSQELAGKYASDSSQIVSEAFEKADLSQYAGEVNKLQGDSLSSLPTKGAKIVEQELLKREEFGVLNEHQEQFEALKQTPDHYKARMEAYQDTDKLKKEALEKAKEQTISAFMSNQEALSAVQKKISVMQRKYRSVLNSNDLSTAEKRNSLKGEPMRERLLIGGNFNVNSLKPFSLDFSPKIGYKFNKKFVVGIGGSYRYTFGNDTISAKPAIPDNSYGYKAFTSYDIFKNFFAYGEYERMSKEIHDKASDQKSTRWVSGLLVGIGREFSVHKKVNMTVTALYNFLHDSDDAIYQRPLVVKLGFQLSDLAMIKK